MSAVSSCVSLLTECAVYTHLLPLPTLYVGRLVQSTSTSPMTHFIIRKFRSAVTLRIPLPDPNRERASSGVYMHPAEIRGPRYKRRRTRDAVSRSAPEECVSQQPGRDLRSFRTKNAIIALTIEQSRQPNKLASQLHPSSCHVLHCLSVFYSTVPRLCRVLIGARSHLGSWRVQRPKRTAFTGGHKRRGDGFWFSPTRKRGR